jgi:hypothetical protein
LAGAHDVEGPAPGLLSVLRSSTFVPGTNIRGARAGAPWAFLLPSLELGRALLIGRPDQATEATVRRLAAQVEIVERAEAAEGTYDVVAEVSDRVADPDRFVAAAGPRVAAGGVLFLLAAHRRRDEVTAAAERGGLAVALQAEARPAGGELVAALSGGRPSIAPLVDGLGLVPRRASVAIRLRPWVPDPVAPVVRRAVRLRHRVAAVARERFATAEPRHAFVLVRPAAGADPAGPVPGPDPLPDWLRDLVATGVDDPAARPWAFVARGDYDSQKPIVVIADETGATADTIVKMTRNPVWNARLENERRALDRLAAIEHRWTRLVVPRVLFAGTHGGLAVVGETAVAGEPFERTVPGGGLEPLHAAVDAFIELGVATSQPASGADHAAAIQPLVDRFAAVWAISADERRALDRDLEVLARLERLPAVMVHGDAGTWNLVRTPSGSVGALDWEAAELAGPPLWDIERLAEAWAMLDRSGGPRSAMGRAIRHLVDGSAVTRVLGDAIRRSAAALEVPDEAIAPLVRLAWVARALKEANRLRPSELSSGRHQRLVRRTISGPRDGWRVLTGAR